MRYWEVYVVRGAQEPRNINYGKAKYIFLADAKQACQEHHDEMDGGLMSFLWSEPSIEGIVLGQMLLPPGQGIAAKHYKIRKVNF